MPTVYIYIICFCFVLTRSFQRGPIAVNRHVLYYTSYKSVFSIFHSRFVYLNLHDDEYPIL